MEYQKVVEKWGLSEQEVQALVEFRKGREFLVVRGFLEDFLQSEQEILEKSDELEEILRAQGAKRSLRKLFDKIEDIVRLAKEEEEGWEKS